MTKIGVRFAVIIAAVATIGCDRVTKHVAVTALADAPVRSFLGDTLRLEYAENPGAFLGFGDHWPRAARIAVFGIGNGLLLVALGVAARRARWSRRALLGVTLFIAGGASNLLDRIAYDVVIDFMNVGIGPVRTGIFNVADMAIMLGAGMAVIHGYWRRSRAPSQHSG